MFNDNPNGGAQPEGENEPDEGADETTQTFDDVLADKEHQAEFDRRITKAINTAKGKWENELPNLIQTEVEKQKSYDELSDEEKEQKKLDDEWAKIREAQANIEHSNLVASIKSDLAEKGLPVKVGDFDFSEVFASLGESDKALQAVNAFKEAFDESIEAEVDKRLVNSVNVPGGNTVSGQASTRSERIAKERNEQEKPTTSLWG